MVLIPAVDLGMQVGEVPTKAGAAGGILKAILVLVELQVVETCEVATKLKAPDAVPGVTVVEEFGATPLFTVGPFATIGVIDQVV